MVATFAPFGDTGHKDCRTNMCGVAMRADKIVTIKETKIIVEGHQIVS